MTRDSRDLCVSKKSIQYQKEMFHEDEFFQEILELIDEYLDDEDIKLGEFIELMC